MRVLLAVAALFAGEVLFACSCAPPPPPKKALETSAAVCLVEVTQIEEAGVNNKVTLKVERWWKGGTGEELVVLTSRGGASCGYGFQKGGKYLVYAHASEKDKPLNVSLCSRTRTKKDADTSGDFKELGEGTAPEKKK